jgi:hypothetical protein
LLQKNIDDKISCNTVIYRLAASKLADSTKIALVDVLYSHRNAVIDDCSDSETETESCSETVTVSDSGTDIGTYNAEKNNPTNQPDSDQDTEPLEYSDTEPVYSSSIEPRVGSCEKLDCCEKFQYRSVRESTDTEASTGQTSTVPSVPRVLPTLTISAGCFESAQSCCPKSPMCDKCNALLTQLLESSEDELDVISDGHEEQKTTDTPSLPAPEPKNTESSKDELDVISDDHEEQKTTDTPSLPAPEPKNTESSEDELEVISDGHEEQKTTDTPSLPVPEPKNTESSEDELEVISDGHEEQKTSKSEIVSETEKNQVTDQPTDVNDTIVSTIPEPTEQHTQNTDDDNDDDENKDQTVSLFIGAGAARIYSIFTEVELYYSFGFDSCKK